MVMMNKNTNLILIAISYLFIIPNSAYAQSWQNIRPNILALVDSMAKEELIISNREDVLFETFKNSVHLDELKLLIHHGSPVVKGYSYWVLTHKDYELSFEVLIQNINNKNTICYYRASLDLHEYCDFEGYIYYLIWSVYTRNHKPTEKQRTIIDSLIIYHNTAIPVNDVLYNFQPVDSYYNRIRELAMSDDYYGGAIVALARYHRKEDIPLIFRFLKHDDTKYRYSGFIAVAEFPDNCFYNMLVSSLSNMSKNKLIEIDYDYVRVLYRAIVQYPTSETVDFLSRTRKKIKFSMRKNFDDALWEALEEHPNDLFNPLKSKLKVRMSGI